MDFYKKLIIILIPMTVILIVIRIVSHKKRQQREGVEEKENNNSLEVAKEGSILKIPLGYRMTGLVCFIFFTLVSVALLIFQFEDWPYVILFLVAFALPTFLMFLLWSLWKVEILKDGFRYRNFIGIKREYKFKDLELIQHPKGLKWYFYKDGKKVFCMAYYIENENKLARAYNKYMQKNK